LPMNLFSTTLPDPSGLRLDDLVLTPQTVIVLLSSTSVSSRCPCCGTDSDRVHSRYRRTVADLPWANRPLALRLIVRRFRCLRPGCPQHIFCERLPGFLQAHARATIRLADAHRALGFALGGEAGSRLADELDMPTSPDTVLRRVLEAPGQPAPPPRYVGIDDWAIRKGQRYGTIVIDLERGRVIDLLPGRDGQALKDWLRAHPGVEVITRDRWAAFAQAASEAAPQARQVADRWHLLKNLREAVEQLLGRHATPIREALRAESAASPPELTPTQAAEPAPTEASVETLTASTTALTPKQQARQARRQERTRQYEQVKELRAQGHSLRRIAGVLGVSVKRVLRYVRSDRCPDWKSSRPTPTQLDPFATFIDAWITRGGRNAAELARELEAQGFTGSYDAVRRYVARHLGSTGRPGPRIGPLPVSASSATPSARRLSFAFIRRPEKRASDEQAWLEQLRGCEPTLAEGLQLAGEFAEMVRKVSSQSLTVWLAKAAASACAELRTFAASVRSDEAAVAAAITESWSNGPVEGHVNRLKVIKRQCYGRAGLALLRARVRQAT
jgi:transposase